GLFRDAGLSMATIQRASITRAQTSTLFWVNLAVGGILAALCAAIAPVVVRFYHEPRLLWITVVIGMGFLFNGATAQHRAILQRDMRFTAVNLLDFVSLIVGISVSVGMAMGGGRYWAIVAMAVVPSVASLLGTWVLTGWIPQLPRRGTGVRSMVR